VIDRDLFSAKRKLDVTLEVSDLKSNEVVMVIKKGDGLIKYLMSWLKNSGRTGNDRLQRKDLYGVTSFATFGYRVPFDILAGIPVFQGSAAGSVWRNAQHGAGPMRPSQMA